MSFKREFFWFGCIVSSTVLVTGLLSGFTFSTIDIQLHDTYIVIDPIHLIIGLTILFVLVRIVVSVINFPKS